MNEIITLAHGSGGKLTHRLISDLFYKYFRNDFLLEKGDSAVFAAEKGRIAFTTDSYVIYPYIFSGGNIGKLAVCGTVNDLAVSGAIPKYISCGFIIEEGLALSELEIIAQSMADTAKKAGVSIVTGDTKVVPKGCADKIFINTSGIGFIHQGVELSGKKISAGDKVILSGTMGDHGTAILLERENLNVQSSISSDCAPLNLMLEPVIKSFSGAIRVMRDPTRGGVATTLNELIAGSGLSIELNENSMPVKEEVKGICEMLGLDPLYMANEGKVLIIAESSRAEGIIEKLKESPYGNDAAIIGIVTDTVPDKVYMSTLAGGNRIVDMLTGDQLPRIC
ncbi:MAG TPA: hydrogenase expression/formation protein HypE [Ruminiclostridium sp.]|nr:hydrogenase expression/formation protein HypE [Ruminiclostridium sp.]